MKHDNNEVRADKAQSYVRIIGQRLERFIEFEYILNDDDLTIELVLPISAFEEFCTLQNAIILKSDDNSHADEILWRMKNPGLLRKVSDKKI